MMYDFLGFIIYKKNWDQIIYCYLLLHILYRTTNHVENELGPQLPRIWGPPRG